jgi:hypothetical protein
MDFALDDIDTREKANSGVVVPLKKLDGTPLLNKLKQPISLTLLGADSDQWRRLNRELGRVRVERLQKRRGEGMSDEMLDLSNREDIEIIAKATTGWSGMLDSKDKPIEFSLENVIDLFTKYPVAREQAEQAIGDRTRFTKASSEA